MLKTKISKKPSNQVFIDNIAMIVEQKRNWEEVWVWAYQNKDLYRLVLNQYGLHNNFERQNSVTAWDIQ